VKRSFGKDGPERLTRCLVAAQVALLEWEEKDFEPPSPAKADLITCLKEALAQAKKPSPRRRLRQT